MKKLIIQIPCYNEESTIALTLSALPRAVPDFEQVEWLLIDDGCTDKTVDIARSAGIDHVVTLGTNRGLAKAFMAGIEASLKLGAEVIVNTDADNQYDATCIGDLVEPIMRKESLIVVGTRPIASIREFSWLKRILQRAGSAIVRMASGTSIPDAPSGFRAMHREAALQLCVFGRYTYTLETLIQAGRRNIPISSVPVRVNPATRPSRLVKSTASYVIRSTVTIVRIFVLYKPLRFFAALGVLFLIPGLVLGIRFVYFFLSGAGNGHTQSLILAAILIITAAILLLAGILSDLIAANRTMLEDIRMRILRSEVATQTSVTTSVFRDEPHHTGSAQ